jgi:hypothetical protein
VAEKLGVTQAEVRRGHLTHTQTTPEAKQAAREAGIIDNDSAMLKVAESPPDKQVETVKEIKAAPRRKLTKQSSTAALVAATPPKYFKLRPYPGDYVAIEEINSSWKQGGEKVRDQIRHLAATGVAGMSEDGQADFLAEVSGRVSEPVLFKSLLCELTSLGCWDEENEDHIQADLLMRAWPSITAEAQARLLRHLEQEGRIRILKVDGAEQPNPIRDATLTETAVEAVA